MNWIRTYHEVAEPAVNLVCLPHAGGGASAYHALSAALAPAVAPLVVQLPGRQDRHTEPCVDSIARLADGVYGALRGRYTDRPLALFGHSMGAVLGFEVARRMEADLGRSPLWLFASGRRAPSRWREGGIHKLSDTAIVAELAALNGTRPELLGDRDFLDLILPAVRADYRAIETYECDPGATVSCPIHVFTGDSDPDTTHEEVAAWRAHTTAEFAMTTFPGGHFFINDVRDRVAEIVTRTLGATKVTTG
jgi:surfactin synthase thioesterase subunit